MRRVPVALLPEPVAVAFNSDPPGAQFYAADGGPLTAAQSIYMLPWGTHVITARHALHPSLDPVKETVLVKKGAANVHEFKFKYGTIVLETDPADAAAEVFDHGQLIARTPTNLYVRPGRVDYQLIYENQTNRLGADVVLNTRHTLTGKFEVKRDYTNSVGMVLVRVRDGFYVGKFEVTQEEYQRVMGGTSEGKPRQPVINVNWKDAIAFCQKLSQADAATAARARLAGWTYALPTESEWARSAGTDPSQLEDAVFSNQSLSQPKEVGATRKSFNPAGLYDLFGNVAEWCYGVDQAPIILGGAYNRRKPSQPFPSDLMKIADPASLANAIADGTPFIGFRCVLKPPP
jgi:formylglycine-generating enzyme required for sulfatase activity